VILSRSLNCCGREFNVTSVDGGLQKPSCLHFNESQGRLFVGERGGQRRVLVFDNVINIKLSNTLHSAIAFGDEYSQPFAMLDSRRGMTANNI
jgi:hypothetical protein